MTGSYITYQLHLSRVSELHREAAAARLANQVAHGQRAGVQALLLRWLRGGHRRARGAQPQAASGAR